MRKTGAHAGGVPEFYSGNLNMNKVRTIVIAAASTVAASSAFADGTTTDYGTQLTTNLTSINTIWGTVATIMIGVALVTVGVRFFRKAK